jgi:hypothetical protein
MQTEATPTSNAEMIMGLARAKGKGRIFLGISGCAQIVPAASNTRVKSEVQFLYRPFPLSQKADSPALHHRAAAGAREITT